MIKDPKWITVFQSTDEYITQIIKLNLESEGIEVMIFDQRDSSYNAFGYIYLHVRKENEAAALQIINSNDE